jgi:hypothetical protein
MRKNQLVCGCGHHSFWCALARLAGLSRVLAGCGRLHSYVCRSWPGVAWLWLIHHHGLPTAGLHRSRPSLAAAISLL